MDTKKANIQLSNRLQVFLNNSKNNSSKIDFIPIAISNINTPTISHAIQLKLRAVNEAKIICHMIDPVFASMENNANTDAVNFIWIQHLLPVLLTDCGFNGTVEVKLGSGASQDASLCYDYAVAALAGHLVTSVKNDNNRHIFEYPKPDRALLGAQGSWSNPIRVALLQCHETGNLGPLVDAFNLFVHTSTNNDICCHEASPFSIKMNYIVAHVLSIANATYGKKATVFDFTINVDVFYTCTE